MKEQFSKPIRVIVVDDHRLFRAGVKTSLSSKEDIQIVGEAENGFEAINLLKALKPDVVLLDIQMPVMDGLIALPEIKKIDPNVKVIIISMHNDPAVINRMMEIGANAYLTKDCSSEEIYDAVITCYENEFYFNAVTNKALLNGLRMKRPVESVTSEVPLTEKEIVILKLMCNELSAAEIAEQVDLTPRTVEAIRDKLKVKTGAKSLAGLIMYAVKAGIVEQA